MSYDSINGRSPESVQFHMEGTQEYQKIATVRARQMDRPFTVMTPEGRMDAQAGDYLVCDIEMTHAWPVRRDVFEKTYVKVGFGVPEARAYLEETFASKTEEKI